ncbi:MAG: hypothetical protein ABW185_07625 [Sedimenticola sp.]
MSQSELSDAHRNYAMSALDTMSELSEREMKNTSTKVTADEIEMAHMQTRIDELQSRLVDKAADYYERCAPQVKVEKSPSTDRHLRYVKRELPDIPPGRPDYVYPTVVPQGRGDTIDHHTSAPVHVQSGPDTRNRDIREWVMSTALPNPMGGRGYRDGRPRYPRDRYDPYSTDDVSSDDEQQHYRRRKGISQPRYFDAVQALPKNLNFDGKSNWVAFRQKFTRYAKSKNWSSEQCLDCLSWSLIGKASDFCATILERNASTTYRQLLHRLEERFGAKELPESAQARFQQASQNAGEKIEDWADRVLTLSTRAFADLPERYSNQQAVSRFCLGLRDSMAGHFVCMQKPTTIEQAINEIRLYQHTRKAAFGKDMGRWESEQQVTAEDFEDVNRVSAVQPGRSDRTQAPSEPPAQKQEASNELAQAMGRMQKDINMLVDKLANMGNNQGGYRGAGRGSLSGRGKQRCYNCNKLGHFRRECPDYKGQGNRQGYSRLNEQGSSPKADTRSEQREASNQGPRQE